MMQPSTGHGGWLRNPHQGQQGGRQIGKTAVMKCCAVRRANKDDRHGIGRMRRMRRRGVIIPHHFAIAVIRGDDHRPAGGKNGLGKAANGGIDRLDGIYRRREIAGMPDHVRIGEIHHDQIMAMALNTVERGSKNAVCTHFRLQIISRNLRRRDHHPRLTVSLAFLSTIQEEGHMWIFLGFGKAQLPPAGPGHNLAKRVAELLRAKQRRHPRIKPGRIGGHADSAGKMRGRRGGATDLVSTGLLRVEPAGQQLAHAVGTEIDHHDGIAVPQPVIAGDNAWCHEFVALTGFIGRFQRRHGAGRHRLGADAAGNGRIGAAGPVPPPVAVHGVVTANQCAEPDSRGQRRQKARQLVTRASWQHVTAIGESMDDHLRPLRRKPRNHGQHLAAVRMHAAGRHQAHHMNPSGRANL